MIPPTSTTASSSASKERCWKPSCTSSGPDCGAANVAVNNLTEAYLAAGINPSAAITSFYRWGPESLNYHAEGVTNAASEGVNGKIEVLECMAFGFASRINYTARVLVFCSGHPPKLSPR